MEHTTSPAEQEVHPRHTISNSNNEAVESTLPPAKKVFQQEREKDDSKSEEIYIKHTEQNTDIAGNQSKPPKGDERDTN